MSIISDIDRRPLRVVVPESIPTRNRGEAAILDGIREALALGGQYELAVYSPPARIADDTEYAKGGYQVVGGLNVLGNAKGRMQFFARWGLLLWYSLVYRLSRRAAVALFRDPLLRAIGDADLVIAGHDGTLNPDHFYLAVASRIMRKPLALYGGSHSMQGRAGFRTRKYLRFLIRNAVLCTVRDDRAKTFFTENDILPDLVHVFPDPAVLLKPCADARAREILHAEGLPAPEDVPLYGLIPVSGGVVARTSFSSEPDQNKKHLLRVTLWKEILSHLLETTNAHFVFLPHCTGPTAENDDRRMNRDICDGISGNRDRISVIDTMYRACELKGVMKLCDFVLGERTHALIGAVSVATPCIALTTQEDLRMHAVIRDAFGRVTYNLNDPNNDELENLLTAEWEKRRDTREVMTEKATEIHQQAEEAAKLLYRSVSGALSKGK